MLKIFNMDISQILVLLAIGLTAGMLGGTLGVGGGIIIIPVLLYLGFDQKMAQGTSMAFMLPPVTALATYNYYKAGHVDWKVALLLSIGFFVGGFFGSKLGEYLPVSVLKKVFGCLMIVIALKMIFSK